jgi:PKD repeat protein
VLVTCSAPTALFNSSSNLYQATFSNQSTGQGTLSYAWDFGDGNTSTQMSPGHTYTTNGTYLVCLTTTDLCGSNTYCDSVVIFCPAPVIAYSVSQSQLTATFTNQSTYQSGSPLFWDFGDGSTDIVSNPTHIYAAPGDYLVCLYIADFCSSDFLCDSVEITCAAPIADFGFNANGTQVQFLDMTADSIVTWAWDFGDGNTSNMASPTYTYATSGTYTVCLIVTNNCGSMDTTCETLVVVGIEDGPFRSVDLYPNPNDGRFSLSAEFGEAGQLRAEVRDLTGRLLYEGDWGEVQGEFKKNMEMNLPAGSYFLQLELNGRRINRMFNIR